MKFKTVLLTLFVSLMLMFYQASFAGEVASDAVKSIAQIMSKLNHHPSSSEVQTLKGIINNNKATQGERTIANALINMEHSVNADDKQRLTALANDQNNPAKVRTLAEILAGINHKPSASDKSRLKDIVDQTK